MRTNGHWLAIFSSGLVLAFATRMVIQAGGKELRAPTEVRAHRSHKHRAGPGVDMTAEVRKHNSSRYAGPPTKFRRGHVSPRRLDPKALQKNANGFVVSFPSGTPIPTPAVYQKKVYVGGGFHSKEFYCVRAETGELVWALDLDDDGPSSAVCSDGVTVFNTESCTLFAVDAETGRHLWSHWLGDPLTSTPTIAHGRVFTSYPAHGGGDLSQFPGSGGLFQVHDAQVQDDAAAQQATQPHIAPPNPPPQAKTNGPRQSKPAPPCTHVLACFALKTGEILWQRWIDSDVMSAPVAVGKELYVTSFAGTLYRFDQKTGNILSARRSRATSAPVIVDSEVYVTQRSDDGQELAQEQITKLQVQGFGGSGGFASQGKVAKYLDPSIQQAAQLALDGAKLDMANGFAMGGAPAAANPQAAQGTIGLGHVSTMQAFQGSRFTRYGSWNFNCMGDEVLCTDPATGKKLWSLKLSGDLEQEGGFLAAPPVAAGGQIFVATLRGEVLQLEPESGRLNARHKIGQAIRSQPVIVDGRIYVGTQDGKLVCVNTGNKKFTGWTMWGGNAAHTGVQKLATVTRK